MIVSTRLKLTASILGVSLMIGGLSLIVGGRLINQAVLSEASTRIRLDLNAATEIYGNLQQRIALALRLVSMEEGIRSSVKTGRIEQIQGRLQEVRQQIALDFFGLASPDGTTLFRFGSADSQDPDGPTNPLVQLAIERGTAISGTVVMDREMLLAEDPKLADQARIELIPTLRAAARPQTVETSGMIVGCAVPITESSKLGKPNGEILGILYGGALLNRNYEIVDRIRDTVFQQEVYRGRNIGTATIFLEDLRVSTNVMTAGGERAVGTRVSQEVRDRVLIEGESWTDRAFVVNDWYITAYEPIVDIFGKRVGIIYVGVLEAKYVDIKRRTILVFVLIMAAGILVSISLGTLLGQRILRPIHELITVSRKVSSGDLSPELGPISKDEIGVLQTTYREMLSSLRERDRRQMAESESKLLQSEKQAAVGRLAAGLAHEINNPLTGVLTFTHILLKRQDINNEIREDLQAIAQSTERVRNIVKGLLDFSRQTRIEPEPTDVNALIRETVNLVANQARVKTVALSFDPGKNLPRITLDRGQISGVLINMIMNALDASERNGRIELSTRLDTSADEKRRQGIDIIVSDTGSGIQPEHLDKLFDPFFTTKEVGKGTGLGLSVSLGIVERHGGTIQVQSEVGKGSTFVIWLPVAEEEWGG